MQNEKKLNILFLSGWYPNRVLPTLGNFVQKHAEAVALHSNVIALSVCSDANCKQPFEITESIINNVYTINVYYKKVQHRIPGVSQAQKMMRMFKGYKKGLEIVYKKFAKIDLVHHNILYPSGMIARYLKQKKNIPYIVTEHSTAYLPSKNIRMGWPEKMRSKKIARDAGFITPVSRDLQDAMQQLGFRGNYEVVYNVVDTRLFHPKENKISVSKIKFLHISTLDDAHKNISGMLRAAAALAQQRNDVEFHFAGDGDTAPHIQTAKELNIYNTVAFFSGTRTTSEVAELMRSSGCFIMFSNYENMPVVISEALASGIPVVSSNVGGIREHIDPARGILVEAKNEQQLVAAFDQMADALQQNKYDPQQLSAYATNHFSYEKVSDKFHELYHRTLKADV